MAIAWGGPTFLTANMREGNNIKHAGRNQSEPQRITTKLWKDDKHSVAKVWYTVPRLSFPGMVIPRSESQSFLAIFPAFVG